MTVRDIATEHLQAADARHLIHPLHNASHKARVMVRGQGALMWDADGKEYLDGLSGLWNVNVGHGRIELAAAAHEQMSTLAYASNYVGQANRPAIELAERLAAMAYPTLNTVFFTSGGAESNESAFKTARYYWKRKGKGDKIKVISRQHAYHGVTMATMSATGISSYHPMFGPLVPGFVHTAAPWAYRYPEVDAAAALEQTIESEGPETIAAFIAEPVMGAGGVIVPPDDYFPRVREICDRHGVLLIADEVITGFGRTGRQFALEHWGIEPDIMSFAKGITSGYVPLGGIMVSDEIAATIRGGSGAETWMHAYTYSGHPTCCAVGLANLDVMAREQLVERAADTGAYLQKKMKELEQLPNVDDARGLGMMASVELVEEKGSRKGFGAERGVSARALQLAADRGLITRQRHYGSGEMIMVAPPLVTTREQIDRIAQILAESIELALRA